MDTADRIEIERHAGVATLWMNRPQRHNAFDEALIAGIDHHIRALETDASVRVIVLAGRGRSFSAGGDLNWMQRQATASVGGNRDDARALATMLRRLYRCRKPTVARVQGAALGGGMGLVAACDIAIASEDARFGTTEVRVGLIPATIGPYVQAAIGTRAAARWFQSGERFGAEEALRLGLVHEVVSSDALDERLAALLEALLAAGPAAQCAAKQLLRDLDGQPVDSDAVLEATALEIARIRATEEGREGISAFLEKRQPAWRI
jgi:methylglutaconyl-CoA hydratase